MNIFPVPIYNFSVVLIRQLRALHK